MNTAYTLAYCEKNPFHIHIVTERFRIEKIKSQIWLICERYKLAPWDLIDIQLAKDIYDCILITCSQVFKEDGSCLNHLNYEEFKEGFRIYRIQTVNN